MHGPRPLAAVLLALALSLPLARPARPDPPAPTLDHIVRAAYFETWQHQSVDEILLRDDRNTAFLIACREKLSATPTTGPDNAPPTDTELNLTLLKLRKAGKLGPDAPERRAAEAGTHPPDQPTQDPPATTAPAPDPAPDPDPDPATWRHAAEIAARFIEDTHGANTDHMLADPALRRAFDTEARAVLGDDFPVSNYQLRKAALQLRKSRRLQPELTARIADWNRRVQTHPAADLTADPQKIPTAPGIYIFRDATGYLYIGEAKNLRTRLAQHLGDSDRAALAGYLRQQDIDSVTIELHIFDPTSNARLVAHRRAYESELIASRQPRFNIRP